jgi:hypothetical protein
MAKMAQRNRSNSNKDGSDDTQTLDKIFVQTAWR